MTPSVSLRSTVSRAVEPALRSGNGAHNAPFPSSQMAKSPPGSLQESICSPSGREARGNTLAPTRRQGNRIYSLSHPAAAGCGRDDSSLKKAPIIRNFTDQESICLSLKKAHIIRNFTDQESICLSLKKAPIIRNAARRPMGAASLCLFQISARSADGDLGAGDFA